MGMQNLTWQLPNPQLDCVIGLIAFGVWHDWNLLFSCRWICHRSSSLAGIIGVPMTWDEESGLRVRRSDSKCPPIVL